jgi:hypothetical protein
MSALTLFAVILPRLEEASLPARLLVSLAVLCIIAVVIALRGERNQKQ